MPLVQHPDLPGQIATMANPRNGWEPVDGSAPVRKRAKRPRARKSATRKTAAAKAAAPKTSPGGPGKDSPAAGSSKPTKDEE